MNQIPEQVNAFKKMIQDAIRKLREECAALAGEEAAAGALGSLLLLEAVSLTKKARVSEEAIRFWFEECVHNIYKRGIEP